MARPAAAPSLGDRLQLVVGLGAGERDEHVAHAGRAARRRRPAPPRCWRSRRRLGWRRWRRSPARAGHRGLEGRQEVLGLDALERWHAERRRPLRQQRVVGAAAGWASGPASAGRRRDDKGDVTTRCMQDLLGRIWEHQRVGRLRSAQGAAPAALYARRSGNRDRAGPERAHERVHGYSVRRAPCSVSDDTVPPCPPRPRRRPRRFCASRGAALGTARTLRALHRRRGRGRGCGPGGAAGRLAQASRPGRPEPLRLVGGTDHVPALPAAHGTVPPPPAARGRAAAGRGSRLPTARSSSGRCCAAWRRGSGPCCT